MPVSKKYRVVGDTPAIDAAAKADGVELLPNSNSVVEQVSPLVPYWQSACGRAVVYVGDMREVLAALDPEQFHAVVTDPPYGLEFMGRAWDAPWRNEGVIEGCKDGMDQSHPFRDGTQRVRYGNNRARVVRSGGEIVDDPAAEGGVQDGSGGNAYSRSRVRYGGGNNKSSAKTSSADEVTPTGQAHSTSSGPYIAHEVEYVRDSHLYQEWFQSCAEAILRVAKPGAHLLSFGGTRMYHRMACAVEDAGFDIRDTLMWLYGSGFPKSHDVSKAIDKVLGAERTEVLGPGLAPIAQGQFNAREVGTGGYGYAAEYDVTAPATEEARRWDGWGTALKPAWEPIIVARKPPIGSVARNTLEHGCGGVNVDGCRISGDEDGSRNRPPSKLGSDNTYAQDEWTRNTVVERQDTTGKGRWPANLVLSHSPECRCVGTKRVRGVQRAAGSPGFGDSREDGYELGTGREYAPDGEAEVWECAPGCPVAELDRQSGERPVSGAAKNGKPVVRGRGVNEYGGGWGKDYTSIAPADTGGASRFFYTAKASGDRDRPHGKSKREDGTAVAHPTVKPLDLMQWLVRLVCAPGGTVLDPFMGSGSTGCAALAEGCYFVGVEQSVGYADIAVGRLKLALETAPPVGVLVTGEVRTTAPIAERDTPPAPQRLRD